jgi:hypothetical protein
MQEPLTHANPFCLEACHGADGAYREEGEEELGSVSDAEDDQEEHEEQQRIRTLTPDNLRW